MNENCLLFIVHHSSFIIFTMYRRPIFLEMLHAIRDSMSRTSRYDVAERAGDQGEATQLLRRGAVLHGRCWKLGEGLEVWTVLYESGTGDIFYADCRPGFRARYTQRISPWALTEYDEEGEAIVHGYCDGTETEVLFELQNLTEVGP